MEVKAIKHLEYSKQTPEKIDFSEKEEFIYKEII